MMGGLEPASWGRRGHPAAWSDGGEEPRGRPRLSQGVIRERRPGGRPCHLIIMPGPWHSEGGQGAGELTSEACWS